jgi:hypothetical protein
VAYDQPLHGAVYIKGRRAADLDMALVWYLGRGANVKGFCDTLRPASAQKLAGREVRSARRGLTLICIYPAARRIG